MTACEGAEDGDACGASCAADEGECVIDASRDSASVGDGHGDEAAVLGRDREFVQEGKELRAEEFAQGFAGSSEGGELCFVDRVADEAIVLAEADEA